MKKLTVDQVTDMIIETCNAIIESKPYLTEVDSKIGDGDHGIGMSGGMEKAKAELISKRPFADINAIFKTTGMTMLNSMGGASGVIFGSMFLGGVKGLESLKELDGESLAKIMRGSANAIQARGKAQVGDKTMIDALVPAVEAMEVSDKEDVVEVLKVAKDAAAQGVEASKKMIAKFGRAKSLMERAVGYQDAGATSVSIIFDAMYKYVKSI
ncbi:MAG: dihydroxyacetone kinase subunit DhaL [Lachnospiraceae bacterium]